MSFPVISKKELLKKLHNSGLPLKFFDPHATDVMGTCHYHTIKDDVVAGAYTFEFFVAAHAELEKEQSVYSIGQVRLLAQQTFHRRARIARAALEEKIRAGNVA